MAEPETTADSPVDLIYAGRAALMAGDTYAARQYFRQAIDADPALVDAWVGLAGAVRPYREKREHLQRALSLAPNHPEARAILAQVEARMAAGEVLAPNGARVSDREDAAPADQIAAAAPAQGAATTLYCYRHPTRETGLRCTSCDRPICADCVRPAAVGQLCPECARARRPVNYQVSVGSLAISSAIAFFYGLVVSIVAGLALGSFGFWFIALLIGPPAGELLVRILERVNRKRGRAVQIAVGICYGLAAAPVLLLFFSIGFLIFSVAALATVVARLR
jgi:tetratricopeptide (TPR) repeat protein